MSDDDRTIRRIIRSHPDWTNEQVGKAWQEEKARQEGYGSSGGDGAAAAVGVGIAALILGALGVYVTGPAHGECGGALAQALAAQQCATAGQYWDGSVLLIVVGCLLIICAALARSRRP